jgi:hypothetical protein
MKTKNTKTLCKIQIAFENKNRFTERFKQLNYKNLAFGETFEYVNKFGAEIWVRFCNPCPFGGKVIAQISNITTFENYSNLL